MAGSKEGVQWNAYQKLAGDEDDDGALNHARLGIKGGDLVLDLLEGERLQRQTWLVAADVSRGFAAATYGELLDNGVDAENRGGLEGEHGLVALQTDRSVFAIYV